MEFEQDIVKLPYCHSTNDEAMSLVHSGEIGGGKVIYTTDQRKGKGQRGNIWLSEKGKNLAISIATKLNWPIKELYLMNIISSLTVYSCLKYTGVKHVSVKWPNDIFVGNKKIAGILTENTIKGDFAHYAVIGIGINVNQENFDALQATSIKLETGRNHDIDEVLNFIVKKMKDYFDQVIFPGQKEKLIKQYENKMRWIDEPHNFLTNDAEFTGIITGIDGEGNLKIKTDSGLKVFSKGDIKFLV